MFDIGFWELVLVGIVALIAIGPDQLPKVAKQVGVFISAVQRVIAKVKDDFEREVDIVHSAQFPAEKENPSQPPFSKGRSNPPLEKGG